MEKGINVITLIIHMTLKIENEKRPAFDGRRPYV